jgi:two-component system, response regulator
MKERFVFLVEDNPDDLLLIKRVFKKYHIVNKIIVASDGAEAMDYLLGDKDYPGKKEGNLPALIILDLKLPKISGLEVLEKIRNNDKTKLIPVVIMTSSKEEQDVIKGYHLGANSYIRKPIIFDEFAEAVRQVGMYWFLLNEPLP